MRRFFLSPDALQGEQVILTPEVVKHLRVLRLPVGAEIELLDGRGLVCTARIEALEREQGGARVLSRRQEQETSFRLHLMQGVPKGDKFELVLQKGVELGVTRFTPVVSGRSVPRSTASDARRRRWQRVVQEAARQSRRSHLPLLDEPRVFGEALSQVSSPLRLMLWERGAVPLREVLPAEAPASAAVLIGPEGGFASDEAEQAAAAGFTPVRLGPRVLRTETAGLAIATLLQYIYGDLNLF